jgi:hypothetical protein
VRFGCFQEKLVQPSAGLRDRNRGHLPSVRKKRALVKQLAGVTGVRNQSVGVWPCQCRVLGLVLEDIGELVEEFRVAGDPGMVLVEAADISGKCVCFSSQRVFARVAVTDILGTMTTKVDQCGRAVLPFKPGDVLEVEKQSADVVLLRRRKPAEQLKPKLVRIKGELFSKGGGPLTSEEVRRIIEEEV